MRRNVTGPPQQRPNSGFGSRAGSATNNARGGGPGLRAGTPVRSANGRRLPLLERLREEIEGLEEKRNKLAPSVQRLEAEHSGLLTEVEERVQLADEADKKLRTVQEEYLNFISKNCSTYNELCESILHIDAELDENEPKTKECNASCLSLTQDLESLGAQVDTEKEKADSAETKKTRALATLENFDSELGKCKIQVHQERQAALHLLQVLNRDREDLDALRHKVHIMKNHVQVFYVGESSTVVDPTPPQSSLSSLLTSASPRVLSVSSPSPSGVYDSSSLVQPGLSHSAGLNLNFGRGGSSSSSSGTGGASGGDALAYLQQHYRTEKDGPVQIRVDEAWYRDQVLTDHLTSKNVYIPPWDERYKQLIDRQTAIEQGTIGKDPAGGTAKEGGASGSTSYGGAYRSSSLVAPSRTSRNSTGMSAHLAGLLSSSGGNSMQNLREALGDDVNRRIAEDLLLKETRHIKNILKREQSGCLLFFPASDGSTDLYSDFLERIEERFSAENEEGPDPPFEIPPHRTNRAPNHSVSKTFTVCRVSPVVTCVYLTEKSKAFSMKKALRKFQHEGAASGLSTDAFVPATASGGSVGSPQRGNSGFQTPVARDGKATSGIVDTFSGLTSDPCFSVLLVTERLRSKVAEILGGLPKRSNKQRFNFDSLNNNSPGNPNDTSFSASHGAAMSNAYGHSASARGGGGSGISSEAVIALSGKVLSALRGKEEGGEGSAEGSAERRKTSGGGGKIATSVRADEQEQVDAIVRNLANTSKAGYVAVVLETPTLPLLTQAMKWRTYDSRGGIALNQNEKKSDDKIAGG